MWDHAFLRVASSPKEITPPASSRKGAMRHRVLLVDDEASIRETTGRLLAAAGYEIVTAENGFDALLELKKRTPDIILSDLNMPQMSGFEFLSVVRRRFPEIPGRYQRRLRIRRSSSGRNHRRLLLRQGAASSRRTDAHDLRLDSNQHFAGRHPSAAVGLSGYRGMGRIPRECPLSCSLARNACARFR